MAEIRDGVLIGVCGAGLRQATKLGVGQRWIGDESKKAFQENIPVFSWA